MATKIGNSHVDRHNARAEEFARQQKEEQSRQTAANSAYFAEKGPDATRAIQRASKANKLKAVVQVGGYKQDLGYES